MTELVGASWDPWKAEHGEPLVIRGALAVWADGSVTIDVGDGTLRPLGGVIADYCERRPDPMGDRFVGRVSLRVDRLATPVPPPVRSPRGIPARVIRLLIRRPAGGGRFEFSTVEGPEAIVQELTRPGPSAQPEE